MTQSESVIVAALKAKDINKEFMIMEFRMEPSLLPNSAKARCE